MEKLKNMFLLDKRKQILQDTNLLIFVQEREVDMVKKPADLYMYKVSWNQFSCIELGYIYDIEVKQERINNIEKRRKKDISNSRYRELISQIDVVNVNGTQYTNKEIEDIYGEKITFIQRLFFWTYLYLKISLSILFILPGFVLGSFQTKEISQILFVLAFFPWFFFYLVIIFQALDKPVFKLFPVLQRYSERQSILLGRRTKRITNKEKENIKDFNRKLFLFCMIVSLSCLSAAIIVGD